MTKSSSGGDRGSFLTIGPTSGKFYWEVTFTSTASGMYVGLAKKGRTQISTGIWSGGVDAYMYNGSLGTKHGQGNGGGGVAYGDTFGVNDVIGCAVDWDAGDITFYKNGVSQGSAWTGQDFSEYMPAVYGNTNQTPAAVLNTGAGSFAYTPPTGYKTLCTTNLPNPTIADGSTAFDTQIWTGNSSSRSITSYNFSPDFVWIKSRSHTTNHVLYDIVRGATKVLYADAAAPEATQSTQLTSFNSDGFSLGTGNEVNQSSRTYVGWAWDGGTSTVSNTDGSITSNVRANPSAGFSIVSYTGNATSGSSIGHGLNAAPEFIIIKNRSDTENWFVWHNSFPLPTVNGIYLNLTANVQNFGGTSFNSTLPSSSVITLGNANIVNGSGDNMIAYCFAPVESFSAFGSYTGNGSSDGPFIYTGFRPRFILQKRTDTAGSSWQILDTERDPFNLMNSPLLPESNSAEVTADRFDSLSNGFKIRTSNGGQNASGGSFIYAAFAEHPFKTARAR
jgi:hypothetical protein